MRLLLLIASQAWAGFPGERFGEGLVVGANVTVALGEVERGRVGAGVDAWYEVQWFTQEAYRTERGGDYIVWAQEHPAPNYGPAVHVWKVGGHWYSSMGARASVAWPLRMGLNEAWWPGPGLGVEVGGAIGTDGVVGIDVQGVADATWLRARTGGIVSTTGLSAARLHLGAITGFRRPENWHNAGPQYWKDPR